jgi:hypothetical protein
VDVFFYGVLGLSFLAAVLFTAVRSPAAHRVRRLAFVSALAVACAGSLVAYGQVFGESSGSRTDEAPVIHKPYGEPP